MPKREINPEEIGSDRIFLVSNPGDIPFAPKFIQLLGQSRTVLIGEKDSPRLARLVYRAHEAGLVIVGCVSFSNVALAKATASCGGIVIALGPQVIDWCTQNRQLIPENWTSATDVIDLSFDYALHHVLQQMIGGH